jgi:hypothetical protein
MGVTGRLFGSHGAIPSREANDGHRNGGDTLGALYGHPVRRLSGRPHLLEIDVRFAQRHALLLVGRIILKAPDFAEAETEVPSLPEVFAVQQTASTRAPGPAADVAQAMIVTAWNIAISVEPPRWCHPRHCGRSWTAVDKYCLLVGAARSAVCMKCLSKRAVAGQAG